MELNSIKKFEGKRVEIILNNGYRYTTILPIIDNIVFSFIDKFGSKILVDGNYISTIIEKGDNQ